jgi:23S rRNA (pseudouridine1915-N3)-methyltransferase
MFGRTRRPEARALIDEYVKRISHYAEPGIIELRETSDASVRKLKLAPGATIVLLDASGKEFNSAEFAKWIGAMRDGGTREVVFFCGPAEGFSEELRRLARHSISLSPLTMSHELARVMLAEQIYRAFTILAGHPYPK